MRKQGWADRVQQVERERAQWPEWMKAWRENNPVNVTVGHGQPLNRNASVEYGISSSSVVKHPRKVR